LSLSRSGSEGSASTVPPVTPPRPPTGGPRGGSSSYWQPPGCPCSPLRCEALMRKESLPSLIGALLAPLPLLGQAGAVGTVIGQVTDAATGSPLPGATVNVVGSNTGRITDSNGRYILINVPTGPQAVEVRLLGYSTARGNVTVAEGQSATGNFALETQAMLLEGVVAVGYAEQSRRDVTGSAAPVQMEQIRQPPTANVV